ncbi:hypothetical protein BpHYR1_025940 [Brachionus plicatilis]|uniref:Uncharacterized protein n=1 Tax=Brachionus plicatilis TaxID=10195 RepID=A0A3M7SM46_BRAPC|nr:hypothetical protein BpHYR1_025940 [Brachionus plicatilis]
MVLIQLISSSLFASHLSSLALNLFKFSDSTTVFFILKKFFEIKIKVTKYFYVFRKIYLGNFSYSDYCDFN